jgi:hypothetical protein
MENEEAYQKARKRVEGKRFSEIKDRMIEKEIKRESR